MGTMGPATPPWCRSTYSSMPLAMGPLKRTVTGAEGSTPVAPAAGVTDSRTVSSLGAVAPSSLQAVDPAARPIAASVMNSWRMV